jgi:hypothetical protein
MRRESLILLGVVLLAGGAWAGTAYYNGDLDATGVPRVITSYAGSYEWGPNGDCTYSYVTDTEATRSRGVFTLNDGTTDLWVANGNAITVTAGWEVPTVAPTVNARVYVGIDVDAIGDPTMGNFGVAGIQYNLDSNSPYTHKWELRSDSDGVIGGGSVKWNVGDLTYFEVRISKAADATLTYEYRANKTGDFVLFPAGPFGNPIPGATVSGFDAGNDYPEWAIRGNWDHIGPIIVTGNAVPDVNQVVVCGEGEGEGEGEQTLYIVANPAPGFIEEDRPLSLTAPAGGLSYEWHFNHSPTPMSDTDRITGTQSQVLRFAPVLKDDEGTYSCVYEDGTVKVLVETAPFELTVLDAGTLPIAGMAVLCLVGAFVLIGKRGMGKK